MRPTRRPAVVVCLALAAAGGAAAVARAQTHSIEFRSLAKGELLDARFVSERSRVYAVRDPGRAAELRSVLPVAAAEALRLARGPVLLVVPPAQPSGSSVAVRAVRPVADRWEIDVHLVRAAAAPAGRLAAVFEMIAPASAPPRYFRIVADGRPLQADVVEVW